LGIGTREALFLPGAGEQPNPRVSPLKRLNHFSGVIGGGIVDYDDPGDEPSAENPADNALDRTCFIQSRDNDCDIGGTGAHGFIWSRCWTAILVERSVVGLAASRQ